MEEDSPLLALDWAVLVAPGSSELQYNVLVYGWTQKNLWCLFSDNPFPIVLLVYLCRNSPIIVCVIAWMTAGSVESPPPPVLSGRGVPYTSSLERDDAMDARREASLWTLMSAVDCCRRVTGALPFADAESEFDIDGCGRMVLVWPLRFCVEIAERVRTDWWGVVMVARRSYSPSKSGLWAR
jgi:hypothetical protein